MIYKTYKTIPDNKDAIMQLNDNGSMNSFIANPDNTDYQAYLKWVSEGNTPLPAEEQV